jgi:Trk-type K+ transport system membrane component
MPNAVFGPKSTSNELGVWMHFLVFTMALGLLTLGLTAGGHSLEISAAGAVGALANAGPVVTLSPQGADGYQVFDQPSLRVLLSAAMITGRLEGVAALMLINKTFWRG